MLGGSVTVEGEVRVRPLLKGLREPRKEQPLEAGESKVDFLLEPPEGMLPC